MGREIIHDGDLVPVGQNGSLRGPECLQGGGRSWQLCFKLSLKWSAGQRCCSRLGVRSVCLNVADVSPLPVCEGEGSFACPPDSPARCLCALVGEL